MHEELIPFAGPSNHSDERSDEHEHEQPLPEPQFGLIDIVEAFTALRHEYRGQVKESRMLAERLENATQRMEELQTSQPPRSLAPSATDELEAEPSDAVIPILIELDIQLSRAVEAVLSDHRQRQSGLQQGDEMLSQAIARLSPLARWFAKPVIKAFEDQQARPPESSSLPDGLSILLAKFRQLLEDHDIERLETLGTPFDGETMKSIGVFPDNRYASGHVSQQLAPGYLRHGKTLKFAAIRVAP